MYQLQFNNGLGWSPVISGDLSILNRVKKEITRNFNGLNINVEYRVIKK